MNNILHLINTASKKLKKKNIASYRMDPEILLSSILGREREKVLINLDKKISSRKIIKFNNLINRRLIREPVAYILNEREFWSKKFFVNKHTLVPRPETELLVEKLIKIYQNKKINILDIGTGSGCIIISMLSEMEGSSGIGIDISTKAIDIAEKNAKIHKMSRNVKFIKICLTKIINKKFDLVVSNPPYIESAEIKKLDDDIKNFEPIIALNGGNDGLDVIKKVIYKAKYILKLNGKLAIEIGNKQHLKVSEILKKNNFKIIKTIKDFKDNVRCFISQKIK